jgi:cell division protein FtsQ
MPRPRELADACGRALRRSLPAVIASCAVLGAGSAIWLGYHFLTTSSRYAITSIEIRGTDRLSPDELRASLPVAVGDNVFAASTGEVEGALRGNPWIASASAQRILPDTVVVEIVEHVPAAVGVLGEPYLVAADGHPFKRAADGEGEGLPVVTGLDRDAYQRDPDGTARTITTALAALANWRAESTRPAIGEVRIGAQGTLALRTDRGAAIELGSLAEPADTLAARMQTFDAVWAELGEPERERARTVHLDARTDHVTVAFAKD